MYVCNHFYCLKEYFPCASHTLKTIIFLSQHSQTRFTHVLQKQTNQQTKHFTSLLLQVGPDTKRTTNQQPTVITICTQQTVTLWCGGLQGAKNLARSISSYHEEHHYCRNILKYYDIVLGPYRPPLVRND